MKSSGMNIFPPSFYDGIYGSIHMEWWDEKVHFLFFLVSFKHKYTAPIQNGIVSVLMKGERFEINLNSKKLLTLKSVKVIPN